MTFDLRQLVSTTDATASWLCMGADRELDVAAPTASQSKSVKAKGFKDRSTVSAVRLDA
jgi:hypothetical protein